MKIEIEFDCSYKASIVIDGVSMEVRKKGCETTLVTPGGLKEDTLGGMIAMELYSKVGEFMSAWCEADEGEPNCETWDKLDEDTLDAIESAMF